MASSCTVEEVVAVCQSSIEVRRLMLNPQTAPIVLSSKRTKASFDTSRLLGSLIGICASDPFMLPSLLSGILTKILLSDTPTTR